MNSRWTINGAPRSNVARYINHSCRPNADSYILRTHQIKIRAVKNIKPGDKITFQVEAHDNRAPDKQVTVSRRCSFFIFQEALADLSIKELGFGSGDFNRQRIAKSTRATAVKEPEGLQTREQVKNEFQGNVVSSTQAPTMTACLRLTVSPASGSLIATTRATAPSSVLTIAPQRKSSISSSMKKFRSSSASRLA